MVKGVNCHNSFHRGMVLETFQLPLQQTMQTDWKKVQQMFLATHKLFQQERDHIHHN